MVAEGNTNSDKGVLGDKRGYDHGDNESPEQGEGGRGRKTSMFERWITCMLLRSEILQISTCCFLLATTTTTTTTTSKSSRGV